MIWARPLSKAGYEAHLPAETEATGWSREKARDEELLSLRRDLIIATLLALPVVVVEMGGHLVPAFTTR